jgi:hypothetical protein
MHPQQHVVRPPPPTEEAEHLLVGLASEHGIVTIDFRMTPQRLLDRTLSVRIDVPGHADEIGTAFPLARAGNPTINARLLVEEA